jgi:hypothetical protein
MNIPIIHATPFLSRFNFLAAWSFFASATDLGRFAWLVLAGLWDIFCRPGFPLPGLRLG